MARYEFVKGSSSKFWEITQKGNAVTTKYGRIGAAGQQTVKTYADAAAAKKEHDKLVASKVKKGYAKGKSKATATKKATKAKTKKPVKKKAVAKKKAVTKKATKKKAVTKKATKKKAVAKKKAVTKKATKKKAVTKKAAAKKETPVTADPQGESWTRYEFVSGSSKKFWEYRRDGGDALTRYGRIGAAGKVTKKSFRNGVLANAELQKLAESKTKKGYKRVASGGGGGGASKSASNPQLEKAIRADPSDDSAYLVYADWLQEQGDPRGELIVLQHTASTKGGADQKKLNKAADKLINKNGFLPASWHEALNRPKEKEKWRRPGETTSSALTWRNGFVQSARPGRTYDDPGASMEDLVMDIFAHPSGAFVEELKVGAYGSDDGMFYYGNVAKAIAAAKPATLRSLYLANFSSEDSEVSWTELGDVSGLYKALPQLEHLVLRAGSMKLGKIVLPALKTFRLETGGLGTDSIKSICSAKWPKLESLHIWFGSNNYGAQGTLKSIRSILDAKGIPKVKHLGLMNCEFVDEICAALPGAKILKQLETLDLSMGVLSDKGVQALVDGKKALSKLKKLDVSRNYISAAGQKLLKPLVKEVVIGRQDTPDEYDGEIEAYVSVGE